MNISTLSNPWGYLIIIMRMVHWLLYYWNICVDTPDILNIKTSNTIKFSVTCTEISMGVPDNQNQWVRNNRKATGDVPCYPTLLVCLLLSSGILRHCYNAICHNGAGGGGMEVYRGSQDPPSASKWPVLVYFRVTLAFSGWTPPPFQNPVQAPQMEWDWAFWRWKGFLRNQEIFCLSKCIIWFGNITKRFYTLKHTHFLNC